MKEDNINLDASLADMMTGMLFVFIIALVAYMLNFNDIHSQEAKLQSQMRDVNYLTSDLVQRISKTLSSKGVVHSKSPKEGLIILSNSSLSFDIGSDEVLGKQVENINKIKETLELWVPCYAMAGNKNSFLSPCKDFMAGQLDSIVFEGHTDNVPVVSGGFDNVDLSFRRAKSIFNKIVTLDLKSVVNKDGNRIFSVKGAGDSKPVIQHATPTADSKNRRIEIRFIIRKPWL